MKLKYYFKEEEKIYTLKQNGTKDAHYKFVKFPK